MKRLSNEGGSLMASVLDLINPGDSSLIESEFKGTWRVEDTTGTPFEITLFELGTAEAMRHDEGVNGTWFEEGPSAVIVWDTGWTTKITRTADSYTKTAYDTAAATPASVSPAEKVA